MSEGDVWMCQMAITQPHHVVIGKITQGWQSTLDCEKDRDEDCLYFHFMKHRLILEEKNNQMRENLL